MVILHLVSSSNNKANGVHVVVPQYVKTQNEFADVRLVNYRNIDCETDAMQLEYRGAENFPDYLPKPYDKPDLVVFNEVNLIENIKVYKQLLKRRIPYVIIPHGEITDGALHKKWLKKKIAYILFFNKFIRNAKAVQCLSDGELNEIKIKTPTKFISTNGIFEMSEKKTEFSEDGFNLVYIGRLDYVHKGLDLLFDALSKIKVEGSIPNIKLSIYGPDFAGRLATLKEFAKSFDIEDIVSFNGPVFGAEKFNALKANDLFIQTSRFEGMPLGIIEAMNVGMPVIITEGTNLTADIAEYGYGYNAGNDAEGIKNAIKEAYSDRKNWKEKSKNAIAYTEKKFAWDSIAKSCVENYKRILNK